MKGPGPLQDRNCCEFYRSSLLKKNKGKLVKRPPQSPAAAVASRPCRRRLPTPPPPPYPTATVAASASRPCHRLRRQTPRRPRLQTPPPPPPYDASAPLLPPPGRTRPASHTSAHVASVDGGGRTSVIFPLSRPEAASLDAARARLC
jgi:hypothetical protein